MLGIVGNAGGMLKSVIRNDRLDGFGLYQRLHSAKSSPEIQPDYSGVGALLSPALHGSALANLRKLKTTSRR
jgi:hypothetical protein